MGCARTRHGDGDAAGVRTSARTRHTPAPRLCATCWTSGSGDGPGAGAVEEGLEVAGCGFLGGGDLFAGLVVVGGAVDLADDAHDGVGQVVAGQVGQGVGVGGVVAVGVVDDDVGLVDVCGGGDL